MLKQRARPFKLEMMSWIWWKLSDPIQTLFGWWTNVSINLWRSFTVMSTVHFLLLAIQMLPVSAGSLQKKKLYFKSLPRFRFWTKFISAPNAGVCALTIYYNTRFTSRKSTPRSLYQILSISSCCRFTSRVSCSTFNSFMSDDARSQHE